MSAKQTRIGFKGQPAPRWREWLLRAQARIVARGGFKRGRQARTVLEQIADDIERHDDGIGFLKAVRRGRGTHRQNIRYHLLRLMEAKLGDAAPRRREDANTPDALALRDGVPAILDKPAEPTKKTKPGGIRRRRVLEAEGQEEFKL